MTKSTYNFDSCPERSGYGSLKWDRYKSQEILPMWVADMDFEIAPEIRAALQARLDHGVYGYTVPYAEPVDAVLSYLLRQHNYSAAASWLNFLPGLVPAINLCCHAFTGSRDSVMPGTPGDPRFLSAPNNAGRQLINVPLCLDSEAVWTFDFEAMQAAIKPKTKVFLLCNPHNPIGRVFTRAEVTKLSDFCERNDLIVISDEIHCDLLFDPKAQHVVTATLNKAMAKRTITLMAPSKTYNLPGLACAFSIIEDSSLRQQFNKTIRGIITEVNCFGYAGCAAAYNYGEPWRQALLEYLRSNYELVYSTIQSELPEVLFRPMQSTYLAWFDVRQLNIKNPTAFFEDNGVGLSDGTPFGGAQHVRLNFGCPRSRLEVALEKIIRAVKLR